MGSVRPSRHPLQKRAHLLSGSHRHLLGSTLLSALTAKQRQKSLGGHAYPLLIVAVFFFLTISYPGQKVHLVQTDSARSLDELEAVLEHEEG
jgi:hypothetical protein